MRNYGEKYFSKMDFKELVFQQPATITKVILH